MNAVAGVTIKLSVKELDLAWLDSAALSCQRVGQRLQRDQILDLFPLHPSRTLIFFMNSAFANTCG